MKRWGEWGGAEERSGRLVGGVNVDTIIICKSHVHAFACTMYLYRRNHHTSELVFFIHRIDSNRLEFPFDGRRCYTHTLSGSVVNLVECGMCVCSVHGGLNYEIER